MGPVHSQRKSWFHQTREFCFSLSESPLGAFSPSGFSFSSVYHRGEAFVWQICNKRPRLVKPTIMIAFLEVFLPSPSRISGAQAEWPSSWSHHLLRYFSNICRQPVSRNLYLRNVKATVVLGTFSVTYFCSPPHICASTHKSSRMHGLDIVCRQVSLSNFPMFDLIQGLETPQGLLLVLLCIVYATTVRSLVCVLHR